MKRDESTRRHFLKTTAATALAAAASRVVGGAAESRAETETERAEMVGQASPHELIWGYLVQLGFGSSSLREANSHLRFDQGLWNELLPKMVENGVNMVVIELGDGVKFESHPEIAVNGAWSVNHLRQELEKLRRLGLEPIPQLNFSAAHDAWLGPYSQCVSTDVYYRVCRDLIAEVLQIFDKPRLFHLGWDEEDIETQQALRYEYIVVRQFDLFWHDLYFLLENVERGGARPWVWADMIRRMDPKGYLEKMPTSVLQSNWYYDKGFNEEVISVKNYLDLEARGYDQVLTGSNYVHPQNFLDTVLFAREKIAPQRLFGFLQTSWRPTLPEYRDRHLEAIKEIGQAKARMAGPRVPRSGI